MKASIYNTVVAVYSHLDELVMNEVDLNESVPDSLVDAIARLHSEARKFIGRYK